MSRTEGGERDDGHWSTTADAVFVLVMILVVIGFLSLPLPFFEEEPDPSPEDPKIGIGMRGFAAHVDSIVFAGATARKTDAYLEPGAVRTQRAGRVWLNVTNHSTGATTALLADDTSGGTGIALDAMRVENPDTGTVFGYQMGTAFRSTGNRTQVLSNPQIKATNKSLAVPVIRTTGVERLGNEEIVLRDEGETTLAGTALGPNKSVVLTIRSEWYVGWAEYFQAVAAKLNEETETNRSVAVASIDHADQTATLTLNRTGLDVNATLHTVSISEAESEQADS